MRPVRTQSDLREFARLPYSLHASDRTWVPPLRRNMFQIFDVHKNPFHKEAEIEHFLARDSRGRYVGRVAGVIHPAYVDKYGAKAFFGFFESQEDDRLARDLLTTVEEWAAVRGFKTLAGPYSYTSSQDIGVLVDGFDTPPALLQSHNPSYYPKLLKECGYARAFEMCTYTGTRGECSHRAPEMYARAAEIIADNGIVIRKVDMSKYDEELEIIRRLYNVSFARHPESLPISRRVFHALANDLRPLLNPSLVKIIESTQGPIAFCVLVPNINEFLIGRSGHLTPALLLRWNSLLANIRSAVVVMIGADPSMIGKGIGRCLAAEIIRVVASGQYHTVHTTWIHEKNRASRALLQHLNCSPAKRYAVFHKTIC